MFGECQRKEKLSSLCETFIDGDWIESKDQSEDGIRLVQTGNVGYGYFKDKEDKSRYISEETFNRLHCTEIFAGDILVSRLPDPIGRACIIPEGIGRMITAVDCSIIRLKDVILPEYFISYTMTSTYSAQINEVTTGTTRRRVSRANLGNVLVPCPSLEAQRQFVAISQQADKSKFVGFKSQFIEMFGNCLQVEKLSSLCDTFLDGDWIESKDQSDEGIRLVQTGNVGNGIFKNKEDKCRFISDKTFDRLHCTEIFSGDILVSRLPDPIGRACMIPNGLGRMITAVDCSIIRLKESILPDFFIAYTMTPTYRAQINEVTTGTTRRRVSRANLGNVKVPVPPMEQQQQFVSIAHQADKSKYFKLTA